MCALYGNRRTSVCRAAVDQDDELECEMKQIDAGH